jgi:hypothetical protein
VKLKVANVLAATRLPKLIEAWKSRGTRNSPSPTTWSLFNAFTELATAASPRLQMEGSLRLSQLFRRGLQLP